MKHVAFFIYCTPKRKVLCESAVGKMEPFYPEETDIENPHVKPSFYHIRIQISRKQIGILEPIRNISGIRIKRARLAYRHKARKVPTDFSSVGDLRKSEESRKFIQDRKKERDEIDSRQKVRS